ncbi:MFS transporter [Streptomyces achromogenes]|uniref:MFS transporter n=1 Tax=Streptomyces achromogenes TaxID=67255 RepID=UPI0036F98376
MKASTDRPARPRPDVRAARVRTATVFAVHGAVAGSFATRIPWIVDHLRISDGSLGVALLAPALGSLLAMPLASRLVHRFGGRAALRTLLSAWCLALLLPSLAPDVALLFAGLLVFGAAAGMADVVMNAAGVELEQALGRSVMASMHGMWGVGGLVASGAGSLAAATGVDARVHFAAAAAVLLCVGLYATQGVLDIRPRPGQQEPPRFALPPRSALAIGAVGFCAVFAEGASGNWSAVYLTSVAHASDGVAAGSYTGFACALALSRLLGDHVVRRIGVVNAVRLSGAVATIGLLLVVVARTPAPAICGFALVGIGVAVVLPLSFAAAGAAAVDTSRTIAGVATLTYTSNLLAPAVMGFVSDATSLPVSFALVALLTLSLVGTAAVLRPSGSPEKPAAT